MIDNGSVTKDQSNDFKQGSKLYKLNDFFAQEFGIAGIFQWAIYVCILLHVLDILVLFYFIFFGTTLFSASFLLIYKSKCLSK
jgi:hypothetical protein